MPPPWPKQVRLLPHLPLLAHPCPTGSGFSADDGASLLMAFRGLQAESASQAQIHMSISKELETLVADPFEQWARAYSVSHISLPRVHPLPPVFRNASKPTGPLSSTPGSKHMNKLMQTSPNSNNSTRPRPDVLMMLKTSRFPLVLDIAIPNSSSLQC